MQYLLRLKYSLFLVLCFCINTLSAQLNSIDHWETIVFDNDIWTYFVGNSAPPANWNQPAFTPTTWLTGTGGIGYGDGDDNTIINPTLSLYMRKDFNIVDSSAIESAILNADYDDAFVAYLNGHEIARSNIGIVGTPPNYNDTANIYKEAQMYLGQNPETYLLLKNKISQYLTEGNNTLAIQVHNYTLSSSDMSARFFFSVGVNNTSTNYNPTPIWFSAPFVATNLPLLKINTNGQTIPDGTKITANLQVTNTGNLNYIDGVPNEYNGFIGIEVRGASSTMFDKKGFGFETRDSQGDNLNVSLLGMPSENDWVLHGPYADKTLLRNYLAYHLAGQFSHTYVPRVHFCEVFMNDQYWGVYVLTEKIKRDNNRVNIAKLSPTDTLGDELTGGYIFKIDRDEGPDNGWYANSGYGYYAYHHPSASDLHPIQKSYISNHFSNFENLMSTNNYNNPVIGYRNWLDVPSFVDYMMVQEITRNIDAYRLSTFMYKEKDSDGGKIFGGPVWDFNLGFGNEDFCDLGASGGWAFQYNQVCGAPFPDFWSRLVTDSDFQNDFNCRWQELRAGVLHTDSVMNFIDSMSIVLQDARIRNFDRWNVMGTYVWPNAYVGQDYDDEIQYLKTWVSNRLGWMTSFMIGNTVNCLAVSTTTIEEQNIKVFPNPFTDYISIENEDSQDITFELFDILGRKIKTLNNINASEQLNTEMLQSGIYFYTIRKEEQLIKKGKMVKP